DKWLGPRFGVVATAPDPQCRVQTRPCVQAYRRDRAIPRPRGFGTMQSCPTPANTARLFGAEAAAQEVRRCGRDQPFRPSSLSAFPYPGRDFGPSITPPGMKRIVLCCDGTWNRADQETAGKPCPTNVIKIAYRLCKRAPDGTEQIIYYDQGVGTGDLEDK